MLIKMKVINRKSPGPIGTQNFAQKQCNNDFNIEHSLSNKNQIVSGDWQITQWMKHFGNNQLPAIIDFSFKRPLKPSTDLEITNKGINGKRVFLEATINQPINTKFINSKFFQDNKNPQLDLVENYCHTSGDLCLKIPLLLNTQGYQIQTGISRPVYLGSQIHVPQIIKGNNLQREITNLNTTPSVRGKHIQLDMWFQYSLYSQEEDKVVATINKGIRYTKLKKV